MRVRWPTPPTEPQFWSTLNRINSTIDPNEFYHISLIDYLQKWDLQKKSEQWWKKLFGKKDVSAQQPSVYQFRFMKFLQEITKCDSHRVTRELISR
jgi:N-glycosylase/DNA lyase